MKKVFNYIITITSSLLLISCGIYSFSGISISPEVKTFEVSKFTNEAAIVEAGLDRRFTTELQDYILNQTNLSLVNSGGDIVYEGEIIQFYVAPNNADSQTTAAENRLQYLSKYDLLIIRTVITILKELFRIFMIMTVPNSLLEM